MGLDKAVVAMVTLRCAQCFVMSSLFLCFVMCSRIETTWLLLLSQARQARRAGLQLESTPVGRTCRGTDEVLLAALIMREGLLARQRRVGEELLVSKPSWKEKTHT